MPYKTSKNYRKPVFIFLSLLILIGIGIIILEKLQVTDFYDSNKQADTASGINYDSPTEVEKNAGDEIKESLVKSGNENNPDSTPGTKKNVEVLISDAGQYGNKIEVRAFMPSHYENGTCTITLTQNTAKVEKAAPAYKDSSYTICTNPDFNREEFPSSGEWQVSVAYVSDNAYGTSQPKIISIK